MSKTNEPHTATIKLGAGVHTITIHETGKELSLMGAEWDSKTAAAKVLSDALGLVPRKPKRNKPRRKPQVTKEGNPNDQHTDRHKATGPGPHKAHQPRGGTGGGLRADPDGDAPKRKGGKRRPPRTVSATGPQQRGAGTGGSPPKPDPMPEPRA